MTSPNLERNIEHEATFGQHMVLVISVDGSICDVIQGPTNEGSDAAIELVGSSIDSIWSAQQCDRFKRIISRTIRSRQVQSIGHDDELDDDRSEYMFVPHGRDRALVIVRDVSAQRVKIQKMQQLAYVDEATKLPNKEYLLEELSSCIDRLLLTEGRASVLCFEIDQMDSSGNVFSSRELDEILKALGSRFIHELRGANQADTLGDERYSIAARIDFRRFGVVLPNIESGTDAEGVAVRISEAIREPINLGTRKISVQPKVGISLFPQDGTDADTLFENSIVAMEDAWNGQSPSIKFHSGTVKLRALQRQDLELELKTALEKEELILNFLPIVDAKTDAVVAVESLLRWPQTVLGSQSIQRVVSVAERTGLILPIGDWVFRRSCEQLSRWHQQGFEDLRIAVNLSAQEFSRSDLADRLAVILNELSIAPEFVELEINEYMLFRDAMRDYKTCVALKDLGVSVVIDDYGTGACSLAHLSRSPVNAVKIDNSFVANSESVASDRLACAAVTAMAHKLDKKVVAEGVETPYQAEMLRELNCDYLQGFLFCKPAAADEIDEYLAASNSLESGLSSE